MSYFEVVESALRNFAIDGEAADFSIVEVNDTGPNSLLF